ncbi:MAG: ABC transporter permease [Pseudomonadota bacterium]|nr:ABC transporter permease [Pseudomonadota bacterium]MED5274908.1 ABC transporter permease [Pseudomonadota bacterium]
MDINNSFYEASNLIISLDSSLIEIISLSLFVSLSAVIIACIISFPIGSFLAMKRFYGREIIIVIVNAFMGLPPVVVGLFLYLIFSSAGIFGYYQLLYSPTIMIIAQIVIVTPIIIGLTKQIIEDLFIEYSDLLLSLKATMIQKIQTLIWDARFSLLTVVLAGLGRALAEVGAVIIVGGNIAHVSRVMTTTIAMETSKGDLSLALGLGIILISISILINGTLYLLRKFQY